MEISLKIKQIPTTFKIRLKKMDLKLKSSNLINNFKTDKNYKVTAGVIIFALVISTFLLINHNTNRSSVKINNIDKIVSSNTFVPVQKLVSNNQEVEIGKLTTQEAKIPIAGSAGINQQKVLLPGYKIISMQVSIGNTTKLIIPYNSKNMLLIANRKTYTPEVAGQEPYILAATLAPGQSTVGYLNYLVPADVNKYSLQIIPTTFTNKLYIFPLNNK